MPTTKEDQKSSDPNVVYADRVTRSLEKVPIEVDCEDIQEGPTQRSSHASKSKPSKQLRRPSSNIRTASRQDQRESSPVSINPLRFSDQNFSLDLNLSIPNGSSISATSRVSGSDAGPSPKFMPSDLLSISAWTDSFDISHPRFLNPPRDNDKISSCLEHMPSGITNYTTASGMELEPLGRWLEEESGDGYDVALRLRHQAEVRCTCMVVQDGVEEDVDGPREPTWSK